MSVRALLVVSCVALGCAPGAPLAAPQAGAQSSVGATPACPRADERPGHHELWEQAKALEKQEQWAEMAATLARAEGLAPGFATYSYKQGYALVRVAEMATDRAARKSSYDQAAKALRRCLATDPAFAECHHFLAEALQATKQMQAALEHYDRAIRADPTVPYFYPPYADALVALTQYDAASRVVSEGVRALPVTERNRPHLYGLHLLAFLVHQARGDRAGMLQAMEAANAVDGDSHPEMLFNLGSTYATGTPPDPRGRELLSGFVRRVCRGAAAAKYADQCEIAQALLMKSSP